MKNNTQKPSEEWEKYINEQIDFLTDHWTMDDREPYTFGGWREEVVAEMAIKIREAIQATREETIEKIKRIVSENCENHLTEECVETIKHNIIFEINSLKAQKKGIRR